MNQERIFNKTTTDKGHRQGAYQLKNLLRKRLIFSVPIIDIPIAAEKR